MKETIINLKQIVKLRINIDILCNDFYYRKSKKGIFRTIKEGYIYNLPFCDKNFYTEEEVNQDERFFTKDNMVYYKPYLEIWFSNGSFSEKIFNSELELKEYVKIIKTDNPYIKL